MRRWRVNDWFPVPLQQNELFEALEASHSSTWGRILRFLTAPWERYGAYNMSPEELVAWTSIEFCPPQDYLTREEYLGGLKDVISLLALEGNVVLHG